MKVFEGEPDRPIIQLSQDNTDTCREIQIARVQLNK